MNFGKKLTGSLAVAGLCLTVAATGAFAASASKSTTGYGMLRGAISLNALNDFQITTTVEKNPDNAYLTGSVEWQNQSGITINTASAIPTARGAKSLYDFWTMGGGIPYQAYGSHGVQGGSTYGAAAVYTFTVL